MECQPGSRHSKVITLSIHGANALYPLAEVLATQYQELHPEVRITVMPASSTKGLVDVRLGLSDVGMYSGLYVPDSVKNMIYLPVAVDAVLATMNSKNPARKILARTGMTKKTLQKIFVTGQITHWNMIPKVKYPSPVVVFTRSDVSGAANVWSEFLDCDQADLLGIGAYGDAGMTMSIRGDVNAIGYDNLRYVYDNLTGQKYPGIEVIPIDFDSSGRIEENEAFYSDIESFNQAVKDGRYPFPLSRTLYFLISPRTVTEHALDFLQWIYTEGDQWVETSGYIELTGDEFTKQSETLRQLKTSTHNN